MLDAGCGARRRIGLLAEHVVGIDPDAEAIARNPCVDEKIVSSLEDAELPDDAYDIVICWNVLEHIDNPMRVLADFARAVKPGGLIVIALPNVQSFRGVVTKFTPTRLHAFLLRAGFSAHEPDPYKTYHRWSLRPRKLVASAGALGLRVIHESVHEGYYERRLRELRPRVGKAWGVLARVIERLTLGYITHRSDVILVLSRNPA